MYCLRSSGVLRVIVKSEDSKLLLKSSGHDAELHFVELPDGIIVQHYSRPLP